MGDFAGLSLDFDTIAGQLAEGSACATTTSSDTSTSTTVPETGWTPPRNAHHGGGRPTGGYGPGYVGVTSVLESLPGGNVDGLLYWAAKLGASGKDWKTERDNAGRFGTVLHEVILDCLIAGKEDGQPPWLEKEERLFELLESQYSSAGVHALSEYLRWERTVKPTVEFVELSIRSESLGLAGTMDLPCVIEGVSTLVDLKTSSKIDRTKHILQCAAYDILAREELGKGFDQYMVLRLPKGGPESGGYEVFSYSDTALARETFLRVLESHKAVLRFKQTTKGRHK